MPRERFGTETEVVFTSLNLPKEQWDALELLAAQQCTLPGVSKRGIKKRLIIEALELLFKKYKNQ